MFNENLVNSFISNPTCDSKLNRLKDFHFYLDVKKWRIYHWKYSIYVWSIYNLDVKMKNFYPRQVSLHLFSFLSKDEVDDAENNLNDEEPTKVKKTILFLGKDWFEF